VIFGFCPDCNAVIQEDGSGHFPSCGIVLGKVQALIEEINVTVPTLNDFDWSDVQAQAVQRLREPKRPPRPPEVFVNLVQESYVGRVDQQNPDGERLHVLSHDFGTPERAAKAAGFLKDAGYHTSPAVSVTVVIDPYKEEQLSLLRWKAGARKGPKI
jgi:hypothetical protein